MEIIVAKTAGYCFGVDLAVKKAEQLIKDKNKQITKDLDKQWTKDLDIQNNRDCQDKNHKLYTYGPIIHNPNVVDELDKKGMHVICDLDQINPNEKGTILIRSHGVTKDEIQMIQKTGFDIADCTCPYVKKIHRIVKRDSDKGYVIVIIGN
jgi:4-hydroxy-3-methylbut-2-enyl diphosphate reductase